MSGVLSLVHHVRLCQLACAIARADREAVVAALDTCALEPQLDPEIVSEAILQGIPYSGFPGAVEALGLWIDRLAASKEPMVPARPPAPTPVVGRKVTARAGAPGSSPTSARERGGRVFAEVYGDLAPRVRAELHRRHPHLEAWIISFAYGEVMASSELELSSLEALGVASLLGQGRRAPLHSHVRGALRTGWIATELDELLSALAPGCDADILEFARSVLRRETS